MPLLPSRTETVNIRGINYCIRHWGPADAPVLFFLHGRMDSSATFQFVVDALKQPWHIIAPDWRGYGASEWLARPYWFHDYYADLDCLLDRYSKDEPARIVGHSMGANIAAMVAGVRPERVAQLVMLDFLGLKPAAKDAEISTTMKSWLDEIREQPRQRSYPDHASLARRLMASNPRLSESRAAFLSRSVSRTREDGQIEMACDPWHKIPSPIPWRAEDAKEVWRKITAPVLVLAADQGFMQQRFGNDPDEYRSRIESFPNVQVVKIDDSGHNVQHDQPEQVAAALEQFIVRG
ncbi:MAG: alpha/beta hydrolase [Gammaproteobacteria bacterium]|nr:alpha/beta hydrolase [Gammaproteobacteria bacterium]MBU1776445.1 alpha/beta hydrolase [Gammaproteobacteria bacterium]